MQENVFAAVSAAPAGLPKANTQPVFAGCVLMLLVCSETICSVYFLTWVTAFRSVPFVSLNASTAINVSAAAIAM